jgi:hypothetical protein
MSNSHSKQAFINMLCEKLNERDTRYKNAVDDADLLIAQTAVDCALSSEVIVIGEDTDLLVLFIHHVNQQCKRVIFKSDKMVINKNKNMEHSTNKRLSWGGYLSFVTHFAFTNRLRLYI